MVTDLASIVAIKIDFPVDVGASVGVNADVGAGVDASGTGVDAIGVAADETAVREEVVADDRGGFSSFGGGDFGTPLTIVDFII